MTLAAIWLQHGAPPDRQYGVCIDYCRDQSYTVLTFARIDGAAGLIRLAETRTISVVVVAFGTRAALALAADLAGICRVESVRPTPAVIQPPREPLAQHAELVLRWHEEGKSAAVIAELLDVDLKDVVDLLERHGHGP